MGDGNGDDDEDGAAPMTKKEKQLKEKADKQAAAKAAKDAKNGGKSPKGRKIAPKEEIPEKEPVKEDSGFGPLRAEDYVRFRMLPKLVAYSKLSPKQAKTLAIFEILAIGLSTLSSLLGAFDKAQPVPLIVQFASVLAGWQAY